MRDDSLPLASAAMDMLQRASLGPQPDPHLRRLLEALAPAMPSLRRDEPVPLQRRPVPWKPPLRRAPD